MSQSSSVVTTTNPRPTPSLNGTHFRVTTVENEGWVDIVQDPNDGSFDISGYSIDILDAVSKKAGFTYELWPPSGYGSLCDHPRAANGSVILPSEPYLPQYWGQYLCGQGDVQDNVTIRADNYTTDLYQALFYVTTERQLYNRFSMAFIPPTVGGSILFGTATHVRDLDDFIQQQAQNKQKPVCLKANTAHAEWVKQSLPQLQTLDVDLGNASETQFFKLFDDGTCETFLQGYPLNTRLIMKLSQKNLCRAGPEQKKPIGLIGDVLPFGLSQFAMGIRMDLPHSVDDTINYWMNDLMQCAPGIKDSCDSLSSYYFDVGGTGHECGYIAYPPTENERIGAIVGIVLGITLVFVMVAWFVRKYIKLLKRKRRVKKRFVWQVARNIDIGTKPDDIEAEKLAQLFDYIDGDKKGCITEKDLRFWMTDLHLEFLSEDELSYLYQLIDVQKSGSVSTMDFMAFLKTCSKEFTIVSSKLSKFSKTELLKFKSRDFSILLGSERGEEEARKREYEVNKRTRQNIHVPTSRASGSSIGSNSHR